MKKVLTTTYVLILSIVGFAQGMDITYVDNRFVDFKGTPVTGEYNFSTNTSSENANVRLSFGQLTGTAIYYYPNGKVKTIAHYKDGKKHGEWYQFNEAGILITQANFLNDKKEGNWKVWDDNGVLRLKIKYHQNDKKGLWKAWNEQGKLETKLRN